MTFKRILGFGTFPAVKPVHGGQRRIAAFQKFYESLGIEYHYASIYSSTHYQSPLVGHYDFPFGPPPLGEEVSVALIGDVLAGTQVERDVATLRHFMKVLDDVQPDAAQLEHPFMWPLVKQLRKNVGERNLPVIYSSHNVESPLKKAILEKNGVAADEVDRICGQIAHTEAECSQTADFVVCVSATDREFHLQFKEPQDVFVVPNGTDRPPATATADDPQVRWIFGDAPFLFTVGSAYPPNIEGFCELVARDGIFNVPPLKSIAVGGGVSEGIFQSQIYQKYLGGNSCRVHFFSPLEDEKLWALKQACHGVMLPILSGGGTNLKTAEALVLGKWIVATPVALRGYEKFRGSEGLIEAPDKVTFRHAMRRILQSPQVEISAASRQLREGLYWDRCFADSPLAKRLMRNGTERAANE